MDSYAAHKTAEVRRWLAANPRVHVHFTPTSGSWLNMVEVWFGIIERQAIRVAPSARSRTSTPRSAPSSTTGTASAHPFVWTKTADEVLKKANRQTTSDSDH